jgi:glycogen operon protein
MLLAGDELGRTQGGNNNAYCQDNPVSWLDWDKADEDLLAFVACLVALRRRHPALRRDRWLEGLPAPAGDRDIAWLTREGTEMSPADWQETRHSFAFLLGAPARGDDAFLVLINADDQEVAFALPPPRWALVLDTAEPAPPGAERPVEGPGYRLAPRGLALLRRVAA